MLGVTGLHFNQIKTDQDYKLSSLLSRVSFLFWSICWTIGHVLGGMLFLGLVGWFGSFLSNSFQSYCIFGIGILGVAIALHQFKIIIMPMPQLTRQVQRTWLPTLNKNIVAFGYGLQLGTGVLTRIKVATTYLVIGASFCSGSVIFGGVLGGVFGFSRAILPIILVARNTSPTESLVFSLKFNKFDGKVQQLNGIFAFIFSCILVLSNLYKNLK